MNPNTTIETKPASLGCQISLTERQSSQRSSTRGTRRMPRAILAIGLALCGAPAAFAQALPPWSTVDDIENGWQESIAADATGNIFVAGSVTEAGVDHACLTKSSDKGATWETTVNSAVTFYSAIAAAAVEITPATADTPAVMQNQLVTAGQVWNRGEWVVSRSADAGASWQTLDVFKHPSSNPEITGVALDGQGNIYVVGFATKTTVVKNKTSSAYYWLVRKIAKDATAASETGKTTFDLFDTANGGYSWPHGVTCVGTNVFIAGTSGDRWQVRKNSGGAATWDLVDNFRYDANYPSEANAITADSSGNLYVVGMGRRTVGRSSPGYWIVRKGTGVGTGSFQTVDRFELELNKQSSAYGVSVDASDNVHVTGHGFSAVGSYQPGHWITRRRSAATGTWSTTDHYFLAPANTSMGLNIVADSAGNVFAAGTARDGNGDHDWVVRRQLAP